MALQRYENYAAALRAAQEFERTLLADNRQVITYVSSSKLNAAAKRTYKGVLSKVLVDLKNEERAIWLNAQIQERGSGWQNTDYAKDINGLKYTFIKVNKDSTFSVYFKGYPVYDEEHENPFSNLGIVDSDGDAIYMSQDEFNTWRQLNYIPSYLNRIAEPVYFININICNIR